MDFPLIHNSRKYIGYWYVSVILLTFLLSKDRKLTWNVLLDLKSVIRLRSGYTTSLLPNFAIPAISFGNLCHFGTLGASFHSTRHSSLWMACSEPSYELGMDSRYGLPESNGRRGLRSKGGKLSFELSFAYKSVDSREILSPKV